MSAYVSFKAPMGKRLHPGRAGRAVVIDCGKDWVGTRIRLVNVTTGVMRVGSWGLGG